MPSLPSVASVWNGIVYVITNCIGGICWVLAISFYFRSLMLDIWYEFDHIEHLLGRELDVSITEIHIKQLTAIQPFPVIMITLLFHVGLVLGLFFTFVDHVNVIYRFFVMLTVLIQGIAISYFIMIPFQQSNHATCEGCTDAELKQYSLSNAELGPSFWWFVASWCTFIVFAIPLYGTTMAVIFNNWRCSSFDIQLECFKKDKLN